MLVVNIYPPPDCQGQDTVYTLSHLVYKKVRGSVGIVYKLLLQQSSLSSKYPRESLTDNVDDFGRKTLKKWTVV